MIGLIKFANKTANIKHKKLTSLQHRVRAIKSTHPKKHKSFFWDNVIERSHYTYNPLDVTPFNFCTASLSREKRNGDNATLSIFLLYFTLSTFTSL